MKAIKNLTVTVTYTVGHAYTGRIKRAVIKLN